MQNTKKKKTNDLHHVSAAFAALAAVLFAPQIAAVRAMRKKANDLRNVFAAFAAVAAALFAPVNAAARAAQQPAPVYSKVIYEDFADGTSRVIARWNDTRSGISREDFYARILPIVQPTVIIARAEADAFFAKLIEGRTSWSFSLADLRAFNAPTRAVSDAFRAHFDPKARPVKSPPDLDARAHDGDTFRAYFAEGVRPVDSPAHLDRRPRPLTL